jgi:hypothetical protein
MSVTSTSTTALLREQDLAMVYARFGEIPAHALNTLNTYWSHAALNPQGFETHMKLEQELMAACVATASKLQNFPDWDPKGPNLLPSHIQRLARRLKQEGDRTCVAFLNRKEQGTIEADYLVLMGACKGGVYVHPSFRATMKKLESQYDKWWGHSSSDMLIRSVQNSINLAVTIIRLRRIDIKTTRKDLRQDLSNARLRSRVSYRSLINHNNTTIDPKAKEKSPHLLKILEKTLERTIKEAEDIHQPRLKMCNDDLKLTTQDLSRERERLANAKKRRSDMEQGIYSRSYRSAPIDACRIPRTHYEQTMQHLLLTRIFACSFREMSQSAPMAIAALRCVSVSPRSLIPYDARLQKSPSKIVIEPIN